MMNKLLIILGALMASTANASITQQQAAQVFLKVVKVSGVSATLVIAKTAVINANSYLSVVTINRGMLKALRNVDEAALVIGHELTHQINGDSYKKGSRFIELAADRGGIRLAVKSGFNACRALGYMRNEISTRGDRGDDVHPKFSTRLKMLRSYCDEYK
jgi:Zn-dependent protease with chaperone function